jgi:hypothetical protein
MFRVGFLPKKKKESRRWTRQMLAEAGIKSS